MVQRDGRKSFRRKAIGAMSLSPVGIPSIAAAPGIHVGGALFAFCSSSVSLARSVCAKLSAASLDSKLRTVSWSSMVTVTA
jgi:hypothetical protein